MANMLQEAYRLVTRGSYRFLGWERTYPLLLPASSVVVVEAEKYRFVVSFPPDYRAQKKCENGEDNETRESHSQA
jgi:hypothetical protein